MIATFVDFESLLYLELNNGNCCVGKTCLAGIKALGKH